jgi:TonB family protein
LTDCRKFDELLWLYPNISESDKDELERHLTECAACRKGLETIKALKNSAEQDKEKLAAVDGPAFDNAVMVKIGEQMRAAAAPQKTSDRYVLRLAFSFVLAAAVVLFMVKSISDLSEISTPSTTAQKSEADRYGVINIELGRQPQEAMTPPRTPSPAVVNKEPLALAEAPKKKAETTDQKKPIELLPPPQAVKDTSSLLSMEQPPESTAVSGSEPQVAMIAPDTGAREGLGSMKNVEVAMAPQAPAPGERLMLPKSLEADNTAQTRGERENGGLNISFAAKPSGGFSILRKPLASQAPDSVNIDAIYVTNENIAANKQTSAASIAEIYKDTGSVQVQMPQSSILVTVEKMPQPLKMVLPEYPVWARKQGLSGTLWVRARVESDGHISNAQITSCDTKGVGFEESALKAAKESVFTPASSNGINLPVWIVYPVQFIPRQ